MNNILLAVRCKLVGQLVKLMPTTRLPTAIMRDENGLESTSAGFQRNNHLTKDNEHKFLPSDANWWDN